MAKDDCGWEMVENQYEIYQKIESESVDAERSLFILFLVRN